MVDEIGGPVRLLRSFRGESYSGWYWSATLGRRIGFGSWVARDHLVALDFDPAVVDIVSQASVVVGLGACGVGQPGSG